jgi:hypothetical protein
MIYTEGKSLVEVVNEVVEAMIKQGCQSLSSNVNTLCAYGDSKGNHCAIGWLLPEKNHLMMDYNDSLQILVMDFENLGPNDSFIRENKSKLMELQGFHDTANPSPWVEEMIGLDKANKWLKTCKW